MPRVPRGAAAEVSSKEGQPALLRRLWAFAAEQMPFLVDPVVACLGPKLPTGRPDAATLEALRASIRPSLEAALARAVPVPSALPDDVEATARVPARARLERARAEVLEAVDGFLEREAIRASLTAGEKAEMLRGMVLTRAVDNRLKAFFTGGEVRHGNLAFQGKGFRSLGQEAIYAAPLRLRRGAAHKTADGGWNGDVIGPIIRDLGAALCMRGDQETVRMVLNGQMGKAGPPMGGKDLHLGDFAWGILPATAPLTISTTTIAGLAMAFDLQARAAGDAGGEKGTRRVAVSFIGEGGSSLGEWHEAINVCAARRLPAIFCLENNGTALSTPVGDQSRVRVFADKAAGYGVPGLTVDGTDPEAIAAAFAWAAGRARRGLGPVLLELEALRVCGHAHHDDMLYLGKDPQPAWQYPPLLEGGYADKELWAYWTARDPITRYAAQLEGEGLLAEGGLPALQEEAHARVEAAAREVIAAPWPDPADAGRDVVAGEAPREHVELLDGAVRDARQTRQVPAELPPLDPGPPTDPKGKTFLEAVMLGVGDALRADPRVFVYGQDVGGAYGNAFLLLRPLLREHGDRILNAPLAEGGILGVCVGAALGGQRPIGEIQFNDFVATGFNQLVNNAAKQRYRWGADVPMVVRLPWGGLRHAGPYHSQNTEPWFYRVPGLKIVTPSTPHDARALMAAAVADPDPVLYYEHIALYRDPRIKQALSADPPPPLPLGQAALRRAGSDLALISYGAYVHHCLRTAERLSHDGIEASVLDLRSLSPLDRRAILSVTRHCSRVLIVHEDSRTGGIGESLAAIIQEEAFEFLDAPVRVLGALDAPVPYSPTLEDAFLVSEGQIERAARLLVAY